MKIKRAFFLFAVAAFIVLASMIAGPARADTITATLDSPTIELGQSVQLTVTVSGSDQRPTVPAVPGLEIVSTGESTQFEMINGSTSTSSSTTYQITPQRQGTFTIPALHAGSAASAPVTLQVGDGAGPQGSPPPANSLGAQSPGLPAAPTTAAPNGPATSAAGRFGSIQMTLPKTTFYVGELVPVEIKALIPSGATVQDLPQFNSDGFTLGTLSTKPEQGQEIIGGQPFIAVTWHSTLTAVKSGSYTIALEMPEAVVLQQEMPMPDDSDDLLGSFFKNAMSMGGMKREIKLRSAATELKVSGLPAAGRPADFSGAVGQFEAGASAAPTQVNAGDPITLRLKISGQGNFDRVAPGLLAADPHWKSYAVKSHFEATDSNGYAGSKTFEQPIIPTTSGAVTVPPLSFSYFDPDVGRYVTRTTPPIPVTVTGTVAAPSAPAPAVAASAAATPSAPATNADDLRPNKVEAGFSVSTLRPLFLNPWFLAGQALPLAAALAGLALVRRRDWTSRSGKARASATQRAIREQVAAMDEAMSRNETGAFFIHARSALQQQLGEKWKVRPETITLADIQERGEGGLEAIGPVFEMADQASYSDLHFDAADLSDWRRAILKQLGLAEKN